MSAVVAAKGEKFVFVQFTFQVRVANEANFAPSLEYVSFSLGSFRYWLNFLSKNMVMLGGSVYSKGNSTSLKTTTFIKWGGGSVCLLQNSFF